jgi:hypothetical protein
MNEFQPFIQFNNSYLLKYALCTNPSLSRHSSSLDNLKNKYNYSNGVMSENTRKAIKSKLSAYFDAIASLNPMTRKKQGILNNIITLTLPSEQIHEDNTIKRECLSRFIERLVSNYDVRFYYWVAEKQKNNNIHFHVLIDRFVDWRWVRDTWNNRVEKLGYITRFEQKNGHRDPNSTDIEVIKNISKTSDYVSKYTTKLDQQGGIQGRLHGECDILNKIKKFTFEYDSEVMGAIHYGIQSNVVEFVELEHCQVYKCNSGQLLKHWLPNIWEQLQQHRKKIIYDFYGF